MTSIFQKDKQLPELSMQDYMESFNIEKSVIESTLNKCYSVELERTDVFIPTFGESAICYVNSGLLYSIREFTEHTKSNIGFYLPGQILVTEECIKNPYNTDVSTYVVAAEKSCLTVLSGKVMTEGAQSSESFLRFILDCYSRRHLIFRDWSLICSKLEKKQAFLLSLSLFFDNSSYAKKQNEIPVSINEIANVTSCSRQYATNLINELVELKVLKKGYRKISLIDINKLRALIDNPILYEIIKSLAFSSYL